MFYLDEQLINGSTVCDADYMWPEPADVWSPGWFDQVSIACWPDSWQNVGQPLRLESSGLVHQSESGIGNGDSIP